MSRSPQRLVRFWHHSLAKVARRERPWDGMLSDRGIDDAKTGPVCNGTAVLRRSVPLLLLANNDLKDGYGDVRTEDTRRYSNLKRTAFGASATLARTAGFSKGLLVLPHDKLSQI